MNYLIKDGIISLVFILVGALVYYIINRLYDSIGKEGILRVYETQKERQSRMRAKKRVGKIYAILLFLLVIAINLLFYYNRRS